jgi:hypothetical protein
MVYVAGTDAGMERGGRLGGLPGRGLLSLKWWGLLNASQKSYSLQPPLFMKHRADRSCPLNKVDQMHDNAFDCCRIRGVNW